MSETTDLFKLFQAARKDEDKRVFLDSPETNAFFDALALTKHETRFITYWGPIGVLVPKAVGRPKTGCTYKNVTVPLNECHSWPATPDAQQAMGVKTICACCRLEDLKDPSSEKLYISYSTTNSCP